MAARWKDIGLVLGISDSNLHTIEVNNSKVEDCLREMLKLWLNKVYLVARYGNPSWQALREAVRKPSGGNNPALADTF